MDVVFFGNEKLATGITTKHTVRKALADNGYPVLIIDKNTDLNKQLGSIKPQVGVLVAYGKILSADVINLFSYGILNIHPSLLPKGRGPSPIEQTILNGDKESGVTIMKLSDEMDKGPILAQEKIALQGNETKQELADTMLEMGSKLLIKTLSDISSNALEHRPQSDSKATYTHKINKSDGDIDWAKPAEQIEREIRAYAGWPKSRARLKNLDCIITEAEVLDKNGSPGKLETTNDVLTVFTGKGSLRIKRIQPAGKKEMSAEEFLRGYGSRL